MKYTSISIVFTASILLVLGEDANQKDDLKKRMMLEDIPKEIINVTKGSHDFTCPKKGEVVKILKDYAEKKILTYKVMWQKVDRQTQARGKSSEPTEEMKSHLDVFSKKLDQDRNFGTLKPLTLEKVDLIKVRYFTDPAAEKGNGSMDGKVRHICTYSYKAPKDENELDRHRPRIDTYSVIIAHDVEFPEGSIVDFQSCESSIKEDAPIIATKPKNKNAVSAIISISRDTRSKRYKVLSDGFSIGCQVSAMKADMKSEMKQDKDPGKKQDDKSTDNKQAGKVPEVKKEEEKV